MYSPNAAVALFASAEGVPSTPPADVAPDNCQCSECCLTPNCCSPQGRCPCFCTRHVACFSVALFSLWLAVPVLIAAIAIPFFFTVGSTSWYGNTGKIGAFSSCLYFSRSSAAVCRSGAQGVGNRAMFDAFRSFLIIGLFFVLLSAILASIRLSCQQRSRQPSRRLEWTTAGVMLAAFCTVSLSFILCCAYLPTIGYAYRTRAQLAHNNYGPSWALLIVAEGFTAIGTALHLITWRLWTRKNAAARIEGSEEGQPAAEYSMASSSVFSHPAPLFYTAAAALTALPPPPVMYPPDAAFFAMNRPLMPAHIYTS
jgi:hypothetical protein